MGKKDNIIRDNICLGKVVLIKDGKISKKDLRTMLYQSTERNLAKDLLFCTDPYPILHKNITSEEEGINGFSVVQMSNISEILKWYRYNANMSYEDIRKVFNRFLTPEFLTSNAHLFGYKEIYPSMVTYYRNNQEISDLNKIRKLEIEDFICQFQGRTYFHSLSTTRIFSEEIWNALRACDTFIPHTYEGRIKQRVNLK